MASFTKRSRNWPQVKLNNVRSRELVARFKIWTEFFPIYRNVSAARYPPNSMEQPLSEAGISSDIQGNPVSILPYSQDTTIYHLLNQINPMQNLPEYCIKSNWISSKLPLSSPHNPVCIILTPLWGHIRCMFRWPLTYTRSSICAVQQTRYLLLITFTKCVSIQNRIPSTTGSVLCVRMDNGK